MVEEKGEVKEIIKKTVTSNIFSFVKEFWVSRLNCARKESRTSHSNSNIQIIPIIYYYSIKLKMEYFI